MARKPTPWYLRSPNPQPGRRLLGLMIVFGFFGLICLVGIVIGAIYAGGAKLGLWQGPPEPTPFTVAADLSSGQLSRESKGFRDLQRLTPDREERDVAIALLRQIKGRSPYRRDLAIKELGDWGQPEDADALADFLNNTHWGHAADLRRAAIGSLGKLGGPRAAELLASNLKHKIDREAVIAALKQIGHAAEPAVLAVLEDETTDADARTAAAGILANVGTKRSLEALQRLDVEGELGEAARQASQAIQTRMK